MRADTTLTTPVYTFTGPRARARGRENACISGCNTGINRDDAWGEITADPSGTLSVPGKILKTRVEGGGGGTVAWKIEFDGESVDSFRERKLFLVVFLGGENTVLFFFFFFFRCGES